jgi:hypothetical protein
VAAGGKIAVSVEPLVTLTLAAAAAPTSTAETFGLPGVPNPDPETVTE